MKFRGRPYKFPKGPRCSTFLHKKSMFKHYRKYIAAHAVSHFHIAGDDEIGFLILLGVCPSLY